MCKKFVITGILAAVAAFVIFGSATISHVSHGVGWLRAEVEDSVPVEFKLDEARKAIKAAEPKIRDLNRSIAEKQVEIRYLERELVGLGSRQAEQKNLLRTQWESLQVERASYRFLGREVSRQTLRKDADLRLRRIKAADQMIQSKQERLDALVNGLGHVRSALENLIGKREELITQVEMLEAKRRESEAKKATTLDIEVDGSDLAKAAEILSKVEKQLDVEMQVMENNHPLIGEYLVSDELIDVEERISAYLDGREAPAADLGPVHDDGIPALEAVSGSLTQRD